MTYWASPHIWIHPSWSGMCGIATFPCGSCDSNRSRLYWEVYPGNRWILAFPHIQHVALASKIIVHSSLSMERIYTLPNNFLNKSTISFLLYASKFININQLSISPSEGRVVLTEWDASSFFGCMREYFHWKIASVFTCSPLMQTLGFHTSQM